MPEFEQVREIFQNWSLYERVIHLNYMRHGDLVRAVGGFLRENVGESLRVLDVGCGDGWLSEAILDGLPLESWTGLDLSEPALALAGQRFAPRVPSLTLLAGNCVEFLPRPALARINLVLASYSLHHFPGPDKQTAVRLCGESLIPGGLFIWVDLVCREGESREGYIHRFEHELLPAWAQLTAEHTRGIIEHVAAFDFPETRSAMHDMAAAAGLVPAECLFADEFFTCQVYRRKK